jgi:hypothetical protein
MSGYRDEGGATENQAHEEGLITQNARYDRKTMKVQHSQSQHVNALFPVQDPIDLDIVHQEIAFGRRDVGGGSPYLVEGNLMTVASSLNGIIMPPYQGAPSDKQKAGMIEDQLVTYGVVKERIPYQSDGGYELPRERLAVQIGGKVSLSATKDHFVGSLLRAKVPTPGEVRSTRRVRNGGRPPSKVVLELDQIDTGRSFAERIHNELIRRNSAGTDLPAPFTAKETQLALIEDTMIITHGIVAANTNEQVTAIRRLLDGKDPLKPGHNDRRARLREILEPNTAGLVSTADKSLLQNAALKGLGAYADLMRHENDLVLGVCTRSNNKMVDVLLQ